MDIQTEREFKDVLRFFHEGNPYDAQNEINKLFETNLDCEEVMFINRCCVFWLDSSKRLKEINDDYEKSDYLLFEWKTFKPYIERDKIGYEPVLFAIQHGYFKNALKFYEELQKKDEKDAFQKAELLKKIGICYKKIGDFEHARSFLTEANAVYPNLSSVLAELADCYSLCGEDKIGKILFREAFFSNPEQIDLDFLDSQLINCLISFTQEKGYIGKSLHYWIPVYGVINGVFNIQKELTSQEVAKLKKNIYAMENEFKDPSCNSEILIPHLLNCYFWLIDHYVLTQENTKKISDVLLRIKILDSSIYDLYIK